jgi:capsular polysaccharide biosynthesis protein
MELRIYLRILRRRWWIVLPAFLSVFVATSAFTSAQAPIYRATGTFIVAPKKLSFEDTRSFMTGLDTLSRNAEIAGTYVEVARSRMIKREASTALDFSAEERGSLSVDSRLLAGTSVIEITVEGNDPALAQSFAVMVGEKTTAYMQELYDAYDFKPLDPPSLPRSPAKPRKTLNLALGAIFGLALGVGLAFLVEYLQVPTATKAAPRQVAAKPEPVPTVKIAPVREVAKPKPRRVAKAAPPKPAAKPEPVPPAEAIPVKEVARPKPRRAAKAAPPVKAAKPEPVPTVETVPVREVAKPRPRRATKAAPVAPAVPCPYIGARNKKTLHHHQCGSVKQMKESNKVCFQTLEEAIAAGYVPCKHCKPQHAATGTDRSGYAHRYSGSDEPAETSIAYLRL